MNCKEIREEILESAISNGPARPEIQRHVGGCPSCRQQWESMRDTMTLLDSWVTPGPSPFFDTRLRARLRSESEAAPFGWRERLQAAVFAVRQRPFGRRPLTAVALGLAMVAGITLYEGYRPSAPPQTEASAVVDLQAFDKNQQLLNDMSALDQSSDSAEASASE